MKTATYNKIGGGTITLEYDENAPCRICGEPVNEASMGGTDVCPSCDCGKCRYCGVDLPWDINKEEALRKVKAHMKWHKDNKKTLEDYRIPGTNLLNFSAYSRENIPKLPHKHKVGDIVKYTAVCEITELHNDCDGTALYVLDNQHYGVSEDSLKTPSKAEKGKWGW